MGYEIKKMSLFTGEKKTDNALLETRIEEQLVALGHYAAGRDMRVFAGCDDNGRASYFFDAFRAGGGLIEDARPEFYTSKTKRERHEAFEISKMQGRASSYLGEFAERACLKSALEFKHNLLMPGGVRIVFPGFVGTLSEAIVSMEESDTARRVDVDEPLVPIIVFNIKMPNGRGFFDGQIETLENTIAYAPFLAERRNLLKLVSDMDEARALIEAYEELGAVLGRDMEHFVPVVEGQPLRHFHFKDEDGMYLKRLYAGAPNAPYQNSLNVIGWDYDAQPV
ncbi:MAG: hypothetical protein CMH26_03110 [Micavibrio sp.]|nr:hypothetical protein [Micavibrio sp.]